MRGRQVRIAVVGGGPVGAASAAFLAMRGHRVTLVERSVERRERFASGSVPFREPRLSEVWARLVLLENLDVVEHLQEAGFVDQVWVAVGTPSLPDGRADLGQVESVIKDVSAMPRGIVVMRSTVPPGTGRRLSDLLRSCGWDYVSHPEFLREGFALEDMEKPTRLLIGADDTSVARTVAGLYEGMFDIVSVVMTSVATAELAKLASNAFLATRISFINEMSLLADAVAADVCEVARIMGLDPRIGPDFLEAGIGYGGSCFPKDTRALGSLGEDLGVPLTLLRSVIEVNRAMPRALLRRVRAALGGTYAGGKVAVWGLAFKAGTDDLRESPSVTVIESLLAEGATVSVHDPAVGNTPWANVERVERPELALDGSSALFVLTNWTDYQRPELASHAVQMEPPRVVADGRNGLDAGVWTRNGCLYLGMGHHSAIATPMRV